MVKKLFKNRIFLCILTALITGTVSVYAVTYFPSNQVTYDNKTSGLKSSDVQGAIDELYNTCSSAVSSGDYLYYAVNRYVANGSYGDPSIYRVSVNGGTPTLIYEYVGRNDSNIESIYVTQDYIYFSVGRYNANDSQSDPSIYRVSVNGSTPTLIYEYAGRNDSNIESIYVTQDYIYFSVGRYVSGGSYGDPSIYRVSVNGGTPTLIYEYAGRNDSNIESIFIR